MYVTQHHSTSRRISRSLFAGGVLLMALMISGCSAVNMTGFSFPVFGLNKQSAEESDVRSTATIPVEAGQYTGKSGALGMQ